MLLIIGNIIALTASLLMVYSGILKEKKKILVGDNIVKISQNYNDIKDYLNALDVNYLSPIEAFSKLSELKQKVK